MKENNVQKSEASLTSKKNSSLEIPLCKPELTEEMKQAAMDALENEHFVLGESVYKFEEEFAKYTGTKYAISLNSGTSAIELSMRALGIKNESVITTPNSFIATPNAVIMAGGTPVFSDIKYSDGSIDEDSIEVSGEKGIIPVHIYGNPCNMEKIIQIARENSMFVIEDACQAHGAELKGRKVGSFGDAGCFSFFSTKNMTVCGDGGMITTDNEEIRDIVIKLRNCGRKTKYEHDVFGFTKRLNTVNAAIGRVQLRSLDEWNSRRIRIANFYKSALPQEIVLETNGKCVYHLFVVRTEKRDELLKHLNDSGIGTGIHYPIPIHRQPVYVGLGYKASLPVSEKFAKNILSVPMFPSMTTEQTKYVAEKINEVVS